ncbi:SRPBCC family protein [Kribbella sandramycini]|uniref:Ribosome-associated toxin RatA of RatAB toxin-antitoxin module n=2 Tax=Kribbella sandramycini TaxID=60450 RepID=A0A841SB70_9ACTN|nr:SRPBCC family protein [Kribbella sandramycini]MBB6568519.1 ribosome-associated toxin RatA of RatAB toxin-antitoxin module [Kribbella sandramycini]
MPTLDISCDDLVVADPAYVAERLGSDAVWREWWPELTLTPSERRGAEGVRWIVTGAALGTAEWWLEQVRDGVVVHWYLRADPVKPLRGRALTRLRERYVRRYRERLWAFKDEAEAGRAAGERRTGDQPAIVSRSELYPTVQSSFGKSRQLRGESMAEQTTSTIVVNATPKEIMAVIADFAAYPEWADSMRETEVLSTDEAGRPNKVRFKVDAGAISDEYTLAYVWSRNEVTWTLVEAKMVKGMDGAYVLKDQGAEGTEVTYRLAVDVAIPMIGMLKRKAEKVIIDTALKGLKKRVES